MTYVTGIVALDIKAGAPNRSGTDANETNMTRVKTARIGRDIYPYVSAQALRRWWRDTMTSQGFEPSPVTRSGSGERAKATTRARGDLYADDDLFGYMHAGSKSAGGTIQRNTVLATGTALSVRPQRPDRDVGVMGRGLNPGDNLLPFNHDHYSTELAADVRLDLARVGRFEQSGAVTPDLSANAEKEALDNGAAETTLRGNKAIELPLEQRRSRVAGLYRALAELDGGATLNMHYGNRTPALFLFAPMTCGANPFTRVLRHRKDQTYVDTDILIQQLDAWQDRIATEPDGSPGTVRLGWEPGFLDDQRDHVADKTADRPVRIEHPRTLLRALADEIELGDHDEWFA